MKTKIGVLLSFAFITLAIAGGPTLTGNTANVSGTSPVSVSAGVVSMTAASASTSGYLPLVGGVLVVDAGVRSYAGAPTAASFGPAGDDNTGIYFPAADTVNITTGGTSRATMTSTGAFTLAGSLSIPTNVLLNVGASNFYESPASTLNVNATWLSTVASGTNGFGCTTNGCRFDFGAGASDYASSDGTTVTFAGPLQGAGLYSSTGVVESTATTAPLDLTSDMNAATASATVPAARICAAVALNANDLLFGVGQSGSCATERFSVDEEGDVRAVGSFGFGAMQLSAGVPTISSGGCTSPLVANGNATSFAILVGTSCTGVTDVVVGMPTSEREWNCFANNNTQGAARVIAQVAQTTTSVTLRSFARTTGLAIDLTASDTILVSCTATPPP